MFKPVQFRPEVEARVRWVEETDPAQMVEATYRELRGGTPPTDLLTASTLAVVRSTELPPQHHGGPLHPVCGVHAVHHVAKRLPGETGFLPIIQHVALANNHVHSAADGPVPHACHRTVGRLTGRDWQLPHQRCGADRGHVGTGPEGHRWRRGNQGRVPQEPPGARRTGRRALFRLAVAAPVRG